MFIFLLLCTLKSDSSTCITCKLLFVILAFFLFFKSLLEELFSDSGSTFLIFMQDFVILSGHTCKPFQGFDSLTY